MRVFVVLNSCSFQISARMSIGQTSYKQDTCGKWEILKNSFRSAVQIQNLKQSHFPDLKTSFVNWTRRTNQGRYQSKSTRRWAKLGYEVDQYSIFHLVHWIIISHQSAKIYIQYHSYIDINDENRYLQEIKIRISLIKWPSLQVI